MLNLKALKATTEVIRDAARPEDSPLPEMASTILSLIERCEELEGALKPFGLISAEGVVTASSGHVTVTTCAEYFHRAAALSKADATS